VQFNCADLRSIQVPKANLGYGVFESAQLQGADLSQTNLHGVWLRHADLSNANLTGVHFGEQPYLEQRCKASTCTYSPDGKSLAVMLNNHTINAYSIPTWEKLWGMYHPQRILCMMYSPSESLLTTGSQDYITRLWESETGACRYVLMGHSGRT
jgi:WD40 repeat protein